jgi:hypothetical protein
MSIEWTTAGTGIAVQIEITGNSGTIYNEHCVPVCEKIGGEYILRIPTLTEANEHLSSSLGSKKRVTRVYPHPRLPLKL